MKKYILPLILILFLAFTLIGNCADLYGTYDQRIKLTIDNTKIDADLTWFPVLIKLTSGQMEEVFAELPTGADFDRVAFTTDDGETQLYGDYEKSTASFGKDGVGVAFNPFHGSPSAQYYNGKTYIVFQGDSLDPYITYYDHSTNLFATPVKVGDNPLSSDVHGNPAIMLDNDHYIHVFWGAHYTYLKHSVSDEPEDISAWGEADNATGNDATYAHVIQVSTDFFLVYRKDISGSQKPLVIQKSDDNMASWGAEQTIVDFGDNAWIYPSLDGLDEEVDGDKIHLTWIRRLYDEGEADYDSAYHAYYDISEAKMYAQDGTDLGITVDETEADTNCLIDNGSNVWTDLPIINCRIYNSNPYILFRLSTGTLRFVKWTGSAWSSPVTITTTALDGVLEITDANNLIVWLSNTSTEDIEKWTTSNGGADWAKDSTILTDADLTGSLYSFSKHLSLRPVTDGVAKLNLLFAEALDTIDYITPLQLFAYGSDGVLRQTAIYHVSKTGWILDNDVDTDFYMYYDKDADHNTTYISMSGDTAAQSVWDSNFKAVYHMADATTSTILDSTSNNNDGTKKDTDEPVGAASKVGLGQDFDGTDDYIDCGTNASLNMGSGDFTIESSFSILNNSAAMRFFCKGRGYGGGKRYDLSFASGVPFVEIDDDTTAKSIYEVSAFDDGDWHYLVGVHDGIYLRLYIDGVESNKSPLDITDYGDIDSTYALLIGCMLRVDTGLKTDFLKGLSDENRISSTNRSASWVKATYNSLWDSLLTYGAKETPAGGITWNGVTITKWNGITITTPLNTQ